MFEKQFYDDELRIPRSYGLLAQSMRAEEDHLMRRWGNLGCARNTKPAAEEFAGKYVRKPSPFTR